MLENDYIENIFVKIIENFWEKLALYKKICLNF